jgi:Ca2+/Na+ antiporter
MSLILTIAIDLAAIAILAFGMYFPRHHRRDLVTAFLGVNIGVLAVSLTLGSSTIGAGLGLGLFGVLSIIRLRSDEIAQHEVAYYFAALALGLISGLNPEPTWTMAGLMALVVTVLFVADHPRLFRRYRQQTIELDRAFTAEDELALHLGHVLDARIRSVQVRHLDLVNDTTLVDVRFQPHGAAGRANRTGRATVASSRQVPAGHPEAVVR